MDGVLMIEDVYAGFANPGEEGRIGGFLHSPPERSIFSESRESRVEGGMARTRRIDRQEVVRLASHARPLCFKIYFEISCHPPSPFPSFSLLA